MNKARRDQVQKALKMLTEAPAAQVAVLGALEAAKSIVEECSSEEREAYDNMPESLQQGEKGLAASDAADALDEAQSALDEAFSGVESAIAALEGIS